MVTDFVGLPSSEFLQTQSFGFGQLDFPHLDGRDILLLSPKSDESQVFLLFQIFLNIGIFNIAKNRDKNLFKLLTVHLLWYAKHAYPQLAELFVFLTQIEVIINILLDTEQLPFVVNSGIQSSVEAGGLLEGDVGEPLAGTVLVGV
jgi:hypothetical protein